MCSKTTLVLAAVVLALGESDADWRNVRNGYRIPDEGYCDQPYVVVLPDGTWLCVLTTGPGREGQPGQHIVAVRSTDQGRTWSEPVDIEPSSGPEASWASPLVTPSGRVYVFYTYNGDRIRRLPGSNRPIRADMLGWYCYRYSDDGGRTWSRRYRLPMRVTECDRANNWGGRVQIFWGIDKPKADGGIVRFAFTKIRRYMLDGGEGWLFASNNILTEPDPERLHWEMLPVGDRGIRSERYGSVQEEHNHVPLGDGELYMVYRTTQGYPCHTYSRDGGRTWEEPTPMTYSPGGRVVKNPRACPKLWKCRNGKFLFWYHNHGGRSFQERNPAWIAGGELRNGRIWWSQPEVVLYDPDPDVRISYPDLIEQDGRYWITETQKSVARVHPIDPALIEGLWTQGKLRQPVRDGLVLDAGPGDHCLPGQVDLSKQTGVTLDLWLRPGELAEGQWLVDTRDDHGCGILLEVTRRRTVAIELNDGAGRVRWEADPGLLVSGKRHHVVAIVDARPRLVLFVVDGQLCDGGSARQYGWLRYERPLGDVTGSGRVKVNHAVARLRWYARYLRISEAVANYHARSSTSGGSSSP